MDFDVALLLILTLIGHSTVAYTTVWYIFKKKGDELRNFGRPANLVKVIEKVFTEKLEEGSDKTLFTVICDKIGNHVFTKFMDWALSDQAAAISDKLVEKAVLRVKQYIGGLQTGLTRTANRGVAEAELDIGGLIKKIIVNKIMQSPAVQNMLGGPPPPPA